MSLAAILTRAPSPRISPWKSVLLLLGICAWLFLLHLGALPFLGKDEPKNAEVLREMMGRGDWVTPTLGEVPWFDKPILYYWVSLVFFHILGPGELSARLACALFGTGGVLLTWALARRLFDDSTALRAGVLLATSLEYFWYSRTAVTDLPLTFCVTLSLMAFFRASEGWGPKELWYPVAFAAAGAAALAKGPVGLVLPALVAGSYLLFMRRLGELSTIPWGRSLLAFLLVAAPWYLLVSFRHGSLFWNDFIVNRNLERYTSTIHRHPGPVTYYLPFLVVGLFPWGALFPFAALEGVRRGWGSFRAEARGYGFLLLWVLMPLLFFSFAGSKLPSYLLPCFPAMAVLTSDGWGRIIESSAAPRLRPWVIAALLFLFPVVAGLIYRWCRTEAPDQIPFQLPLALSLACTCAVLAMLAAMKRYSQLFPACAAGTVLSLSMLVFFSLGSVREQASLTRIAAKGVELARQGQAVVAYRNFHNYLYFYTENRVPLVKRLPQLERLLEEKGAVYCFLEKPGLEELRRESYRVETMDRQYKVTLARVSLPEGRGVR
ncbi:MAG TPA: glycosyltransferase family 39 protein [Candidatus Polarisedimenticolia bacterium]|nr:glycosyltransferase family 39 protein [Candidatus Polarisedimenticolia bacterium]